jgi:4-aminobutyrate aminotransferase-like enzyme
VLEVLEQEQLMANALSTGTHFRERLAELARSHACLGEVRGHGLLLGVEVLDPDGSASPRLARSVINELREAGVLIGSEGPGGNVLKLRPPMCFGPEHADRVAEELEAVLRRFGTNAGRRVSAG